MWPIARRVAAVMWLEMLYILRDRTTRGLLVMVPAVQLMLFGYAVDFDPRGVRLAIAGGSPEAQQAARDVAAGTGRFTITAGLPSGAAQARLERVEADIALELPAETDDAPAPPRLIVDASDPSAVRPAVAALETAWLRRLAARGTLSGAPTVALEWRYNPELRTAWSIVPGLAGALVMIGMLMLGALCMVRERERGSLELLRASPATPGETMAGKLLPYWVIGCAQAVLVLALGHVLFALPSRGAPWVLLGAIGLTAAAYLTLGFAISCAARNQMQAIQAAVFLYLPSILLSGFLFPFTAMPRWARALGEALPLTHLTRIARDTLLRGGAASPVADVLALAAIAVATFALAAAVQRWRSE